MKKKNYILDKPVKKVWNLNGLQIGQTLSGIPTASHYINRKGNDFLLLKLDYGHAICNIYFLIFSFPEEKFLNKNIHNSFELVKYYRESNNIAIDEDITMFHDIDWQEIIDWVNKEETMKIQVINQNMNGFKNIKFLPTKNYI